MLLFAIISISTFGQLEQFEDAPRRKREKDTTRFRHLAFEANITDVVLRSLNLGFTIRSNEYYEVELNTTTNLKGRYTRIIDTRINNNVYFLKPKVLNPFISIGAIIIRLIEASKIMDTVYVLTSGGPGTATETSSFYIFIKGLREFQFGYSAALSLTYLIIMIISFTIIAKILVKLMVRGN